MQTVVKRRTPRCGNPRSTRLAAAIAVLLATPAPVVWAQQAAAPSDKTATEPPAKPAASAPESDSGLVTVMVTARKRVEPLTSVPLAITAITADDIEAKGITDLGDIAAYTPGFRFQNQSVGRNDRGFKQYVIRGMVPNSALATRQSVTVFVDGAPVSGGNISGVDDIERVEVVKGPQSAFFGRSTFAGAVNVITREPDFFWGGSASVDVASHGTKDVSASLEGPLVDKSLAFRLGVRSYHTDGDYSDTGFDGYRLGERNTQSVSLNLLAKPVTGLKIRMFGTYWQDDDGLPANSRYGSAQHNCAAKSGSTALNYTCGALSDSPAANRAWDTYIEPTALESIRSHGTLFGSDFMDHLGLHRDAAQLRFNAEYALGDYTLNAIGAYGKNKWGFLQTVAQDDTREVANPNYGKISGVLPYWYTLTEGNTEDRDHYLELRLSSPAEQALTWSIGANYAYERTDNFTAAYGLGGYTLNTPHTINSSDTYGVFGSAKYNFTERWSVSLEGRRQEDKLSQETLSGTNPAFSGNFNSFNPRAILQFQPSRDTSIYTSYATGNRPGEFNTVYYAQPAYVQAQIAQQANVQGTVPEDKVKMGELGFKGALLDNRLSLLAAIYYGEWTGRHIPNTVYYTDLNGVSQNLQVTAANGTVALKGLELEAAYKPISSLKLEGTFNIADTKILRTYSTDALLLTGNANPVGKQLPYYPKFAGSASATYSHQVFGGHQGYVRGDVLYTGHQFDSEANLAYTKAATTANLRFGTQFDAYQVELYGTNIFDNKTPTSLARSQEPVTNAQGITVSLPDRRTVGMRLTADF